MKNVNFHYIIVLLDMLYGITLNVEDVEELGLLGWEYIGNKNTRLYRYSTRVDSDLSIKLPCNASSVEAVTSSFEDWNAVTNYSEHGDFNSQFVESSIEAEKIFTNPYYISGKLLPYELVDDTLYFNKDYGVINILYKGIISDEDGLPELTDKEANALATYIAYVTKYKEGLKTNNQALIQQSDMLYNKWLKQCDQARVSKLSQNDMNEILNVKNSWNRHNYGFSSKPFYK